MRLSKQAVKTTNELLTYRTLAIAIIPVIINLLTELYPELPIIGLIGAAVLEILRLVVNYFEEQ